MKRIIRETEISQALQKQYRQYLCGRLEKPQPYLEHIEDDIEVGISWYQSFKADQPHIHPICVERTYVLEGCIRFRLLDGSGKTFELQQGDFFILPPNTPYVTKNTAGTKVLFIKSPGTNDKLLVEVDQETEKWMSAWDE